ncbi:predicted protein [Uncinocarpus reesii 1704]|uniref:Protein kinase domain-containing protein n=1 Tax=Uncinocarpus reesii (strain UAMH 1704) TaxID=336963 RepID=C4JUI7_UNCRE|nr:uncharacterized protein UREG_04790 [Uncinocarpus reesii 1704]EEP79948.1 predicted protein [Uncinocarpus reesii 1704]
MPLSLQTPLAGCSNLRVVTDTIPEHLLFVYEYFTGDLFDLVGEEGVSLAAKKTILRDGFTGLAALHENRILNGDIKPNNIFVDYEISDGVVHVKRTQIGDLEMGSDLPPGLNVRGALLGNPMWRSPESRAAARINLPSDVFSYGLVCIFTVLRQIIFRIDKEGLSGAERERIIVKRLLSYFGDGPGLVGFLGYLDDESARWRDLVLAVAEEFNPDDARQPFAMWNDVDELFRDLIVKMTNLDPTQRITAKEALQHPWFQDV